MAFKTVFFALVLVSVSVSSVLGSLDCEDLPVEDCAFAVSSSGARCVLEKYLTQDDNTVFQCQTSNIIAGKAEEWVETEDCLNACGLEKITVGMSSDGLLQKKFAQKLCSPDCQNNCPNIVDLYIKLAAGEGVYLPGVCNYLKPSSRRLIGELEFDRSLSALLSTWDQEIASAPAPSFPDQEIASAPAPSSKEV